MSWDYYPDGKLKSKSDDGVPAGKSVVLLDNSDTQNTTSTGLWTRGDIAGQQGYDHQTHAAVSRGGASSPGPPSGSRPGGGPQRLTARCPGGGDRTGLSEPGVLHGVRTAGAWR
jgi:hypothetical protein